jgi:hypothetical protein
MGRRKRTLRRGDEIFQMLLLVHVVIRTIAQYIILLDSANTYILFEFIGAGTGLIILRVCLSMSKTCFLPHLYGKLMMPCYVFHLLRISNLLT